MTLCIECKTNALTGQRTKFCCNKCKQIHYDKKDRIAKKKVIEITFPHYTCQHCGHKWLLKFEPRTSRNFNLWNDLKCPECKKPRVGFDKSCEYATIQPSNK